MKKNKLNVLLLGVICATVLFLGSGQEAMASSALAAPAKSQIIIEDEAVPLAGAAALTPVASGKVTKTQGNVTMDASNTSQGYVMLKYAGNNPKLKIQIAKGNGTTYTYNLNARNQYEVFPLTDGDGAYSVKVFENISGTKYSQAFSQVINVKLANQNLPFLYPNQYVNFNANSKTVKKGLELTKGQTDDLKKVETVYDFTVSYLTYDTAKANTVQTGYLPNIDTTLATKKGICFDYASMMTSMLRSQNIPCKLVVGYTGDIYHAWINVYTADTGWVDGLIFFDGKKWQMMDPTFASSGKKSEAIMKYINTPSNYKAKYIY